MKLFKKAAMLTLNAALVVISATNKMLQHRASGAVFRAAGAIMFTVMAIGLFPAAGEVAQLQSDVGAAVEAADSARARVQIIYRDNAGSEWAYTAARRLAAELADRYNYDSVLTPASVAGVGDPDDEGGAIVIGHTDLSESEYAESYYSVGADGCHTYFNSRGDLIIEAFGSAGAETGIDLFLTNYNADSAAALKVKQGETVPDLDAVLSNVGNYRSDDDGIGVVTEIATVADGQDFRALVLASPDDNSYTLRAISALLDAEKPDLVVFAGDLAAGAADRAELIAAWDKIIAPLGERKISWNFIPMSAKTADGGLSAVTVNEVVASRAGCIGMSGDAALVEIKSDRTLGGIWLIGGDTAESVSGIAEKIAAGRSTTDGAPTVLITSGIPADEIKTAGAVHGNASSAGSEQAIELPDGNEVGTLRRIIAAGVACIVESDGSGEVGSTMEGSATLISAGSVGFESPGLGGRFEYNNSLRGGVLITLDCTGGGEGFRAKYIYTADLGANER